MFQPSSIQSSLSFRDKILSIDYILVVLNFILGIQACLQCILQMVENLNIIQKVTS